jgi:hypothetical protein
MNARGHSSWSQHNSGTIAITIMVGTACILLPPILILVIPLGIICAIAFALGFLRAWNYARGPMPTLCAWCGRVEPVSATGWRMIYGSPCCPYHPW